MSNGLHNRIKDSITGMTGTGAYTGLNGAAGTHLETFSDRYSDGDMFPYYATDNAAKWEAGIGTYVSATNSITRTSVLKSSNSDAAVNWAGENIDLYVEIIAERGGPHLWDMDGDTGVQVEESDDEDIIRFDIAGTQKVSIDASGVMIGDGFEHDLGVGLHIKSADSGLSAIDADADELIIEGSGNSGLSILSGASSQGAILFGDSGDADVGHIIYDHSDNTMAFSCGGIGVDILTLDDGIGGGVVFIRDTANANMNVGLTINQQGHDNEIFALKSTDVAHGLTSQAETDTFAKVQKTAATTGGFSLFMFHEDTAASNPHIFYGYGGTAGTGKTTADWGLISFYALEHNGSNTVTDLATNGNAFAIKGRVGSTDRLLFVVDEDGDYHYDGADGGAFDEHHDAPLIDTFNQIIGTQGGKPDWDRLNLMADLRLMGRITPEEWDEGIRPLVNGAQIQRLLVGNAAQAWMREQVRDTILAQIIPGYRGALEQLAAGRNVGGLPELLAA